MTTIAVNHEMMAGDSLYVDGNIRGTLKTKLYRINGDILGYAGSAAEGQAFMHWYEDQTREKPDFNDTTVIVLKSDGTIETWEACYFPTIMEDHPFYAIGSGSHFAMGAMYAGADPKEAVKIAAKLDAYSGGRVKVLRL